MDDEEDLFAVAALEAFEELQAADDCDVYGVDDQFGPLEPDEHDEE